MSGSVSKGTVSKGTVRASLALSAALVSTVLCATASTAVPDDAGPGTRATAASRERACPIVYFDLGETLVHTAEDGGIGFRSGAASYLHALRIRHVKIGLITNVPPSWGATDAERAARLRQEVDAAWRGSTPFPWQDFGDRVLTPRTEAERKPAPALWQRAKAGAGPCRVVYEAEAAEEVTVASSLGFVPYQVGRPHQPAFLPVGLVEALGRRSPS